MLSTEAEAAAAAAVRVLPAARWPPWPSGQRRHDGHQRVEDSCAEGSSDFAPAQAACLD